MTSGCTKTEEGYDCSLVCESIWFKVWNATAAGDYGKYCDKGLIGKYGNILYSYRWLITMQRTWMRYATGPV